MKVIFTDKKREYETFENIHTFYDMDNHYELTINNEYQTKYFLSKERFKLFAIFPH